MTNHEPINDGVRRWTRDAAQHLYDTPFLDLLHRAQTVHRAHFPASTVEKAQLLSIKTGGCPEDCGYCSQSARFETGLAASKLMDVEAVAAAAQEARSRGATRFCMGAAWRGPKDRDMDTLCRMLDAVKGLGLETCMTLGMLEDGQAERLRDAGLDYYNHNVDTSPEHYDAVVTTRTFQDRLDTLAKVRAAGVAVCCGGILGLGETAEDRVSMLVTLANLPKAPESVPINALMPQPGTPLADAPAVDPIDLARTIAVARIMMPTSVVRLSAGRDGLTASDQALCFFAGANSIFTGSRLLTADNPDEDADAALFSKLGLTAAGLGRVDAASAA